jgi:glutamyl-tRNA reductase
MRYQLLGINHRTAPVSVRERLAIPDSRLPEAMRRLCQWPGVEEGLVLSTCNRVEVLAATASEGPGLRAFLEDYAGVPAAELAPHLYEFQDRDAIRHLFRVAASLDSMVVGEPQILGQVKEAYACGRSVGAVAGHLDPLLTRSFAVAKRVRTETQVGSSSVSIASVAVDLARKIFGSLEGKSVFLVGAGKMSELAARHLMAQGAGSIFVSNRTYERAERLAERFSARVIRFDDLYDKAGDADIVITSTGAPHAIFRKEHGRQFLQKRRNAPMFFIDIAVPRDVAPEMNELDGIFVYDIDDLQSVVSSHVADRRREARRAEEIIEAEVVRFTERIQTREVVPTIISLQEQLETIRQAEIDKVRGRLGRLTPEQELAIEALSKGIVNKVLHAPISTLKSAARSRARETTTVIELVRRMFNLDRPKEDAEQDPAGTTRVER